MPKEHGVKNRRTVVLAGIFMLFSVSALFPCTLAAISGKTTRNGRLFNYFEYVDSDYAADMAKMAADPKTREWWKLTDPCQQPVETAAKDEWWAPMRELFHSDLSASRGQTYSFDNFAIRFIIVKRVGLTPTNRR